MTQERPTPETDAQGYGDGRHPYVSTDFARRLERQRDEAIEVLSAIDERFADGDDTYEDWKFMGEAARKFLEKRH